MAYEYSKIAKVLPKSGGSTNLGFQGYVTLPKASGSEPAKYIPKDYGYINTYVAVAGFECGISTKRALEFYDNATGTYQWRWFVNGPEQKNGPYSQFKDGDRIHLKLVILSNGKVQFWVNGVSAFVSDGTYKPNSLFPARLIIAAEQERWTTLPSTLPPFDLRHNQIAADSLMYQNSSGTWVTVTSGNTGDELLHWPDEFSLSQTPDPKLYTVTNDLANARYYAAIKNL
jgi:hypothetical protein